MIIGILEKVMNMALAEAVKTVEPTYTINDSMNVLLGKLDGAIDDMENGRVQTIDENGNCNCHSNHRVITGTDKTHHLNVCRNG